LPAGKATLGKARPGDHSSRKVWGRGLTETGENCRPTRGCRGNVVGGNGEERRWEVQPGEREKTSLQQKGIRKKKAGRPDKEHCNSRRKSNVGPSPPQRSQSRFKPPPGYAETITRGHSEGGKR